VQQLLLPPRNDSLHGELGLCLSRHEMHRTYLVVDLLRSVEQSDGLFENVPALLQLLALGPVVKGAGHVDIGGGVFPMEKRWLARNVRGAQSLAAAAATRRISTLGVWRKLTT
jgi:hypothetical protein